MIYMYRLPWNNYPAWRQVQYDFLASHCWYYKGFNNSIQRRNPMCRPQKSYCCLLVKVLPLARRFPLQQDQHLRTDVCDKVKWTSIWLVQFEEATRCKSISACLKGVSLGTARSSGCRTWSLFPGSGVVIEGLLYQSMVYGLLGFNASTARVISIKAVKNDDEISYLVEETGLTGGNHRPAARNWRDISHIYTPSAQSGDWTLTAVVWSKASYGVMRETP